MKTAFFNFLSIAAGGLIVLALQTHAEPFVWGEDEYGQLGIDGDTYSTTTVPMPANGPLRGKSVVLARASGHSTLMLTADGMVFGCGANFYGQLGDATEVNRALPVAMNLTPLGGRTVLDVDGGETHSLLLTADGRVFATGAGGSGQLGNGAATRSQTLVPVDMDGVMAGRTIMAIAAGAEFSLALASSGEIFAWGRNQHGQLGDGTTTNRSAPVAMVQSGALAGRTVMAIAAGTAHGMALTRDGRVFTWGRNFAGQLGDGTETDRSTPVAVSTAGVLAGKILTVISGGGNHSLALDNTGRAYAWGYNPSGQLGDGSNTYRPLPVAVSTSGALSGVVLSHIEAATFHSMALSSQGLLFGWGNNSNGEIVQGSSGTFTTPRAAIISGQLKGRRITSLSSGFAHNIALTLLPEIAVEQPAGNSLTDGGATVDFGDVPAGGMARRTFIVRNTGGDLLHPGPVTIAGTHADDFTLTLGPEAAVNGGGATRFTVRFMPTGPGTRSATLHLPSNDIDETPFDITLTGTRP